jgi:hypothetical protein
VRIALLALLLAGCGEERAAVYLPPNAPAGEFDVHREGDRVLVSAPGVEIDATAGDLTFESASLSAAVGTSHADAQRVTDDASLALVDGVVEFEGRVYPLATERDAAVEALAPGPLGEAFRALAPFRGAILGHLAEAEPLFLSIGLFQRWPDGEEPPWPSSPDPRDAEPPGHLDGDIVGLGMTCSSAIRCPSDAPYCVSATHESTYGFCTRACTSDAQCGAPNGRCTLTVSDIPDVPGAIAGCALDCTAPCPGLLTCTEATGTCDPP